MVTSDALLEVLYNFAQKNFKDFAERIKEIAIQKDNEAAIFALLGTAESVDGIDFMVLPDGQKRVFYEVVAQHIIFLMRFPELQFPRSLLVGSSVERLATPLLRYLAESPWPYPQLLPYQVNP